MPKENNQDVPPVDGDKDPATEMTIFKSGDIEFEMPKPVYDAIKRNVSMESIRLRNELSEYKQKVQEYEDKQISQQDTPPASSRKPDPAIEMEIQTKDKRIKELETGYQDITGRYNNMLKQSAISEAISRSGYQVVNQKQVEMLLSSEFNFELVNDKGRDLVIAKKGDDFIAVDDAVASFLNNDANSHFIVSNLKPGTGTTKGSTKPGNAPLTYKRSDLQNEDTRKEYISRLQAGEAVNITD